MGQNLFAYRGDPIFLALQFLVSFLLGQFVLPHVNETTLFFREGLYSGYDVIIFSIKYYGLAFLSLLVFGAVIESISLACKTITGTIGASLGFLFASGIFVVMLGEFAKGSSYEHAILSMSLLYTQAKGIAFLHLEAPMCICSLCSFNFSFLKQYLTHYLLLQTISNKSEGDCRT
ncbi:hypothetical protein ACLMAB_06450 [Brevibacillus laterosporus]